MNKVSAKNLQYGFTLIELMVVVCIIGLLTSMAMTSYLAYSKRTQVATGLVLATRLQSALVDYYATNNKMPDGDDDPYRYINEDIGAPDGYKLASPGLNPVYSVYIWGLDQGVISISYHPEFMFSSRTTMTGDAQGQLRLIPTINNGTITWECVVRNDGWATIFPRDWVPGNCRYDSGYIPV